MKARLLRMKVESLDGRIVPSTVAYGDFNNDGLMDRAAITAPNTITVSLATPTGGYTVSATLTTPNNRPMSDLYVYDADGDGNQDDVVATTQQGNNTYFHRWLGLGDGTFGERLTTRWHPPHNGGWI